MLFAHNFLKISIVRLWLNESQANVIPQISTVTHHFHLDFDIGMMHGRVLAAAEAVAMQEAIDVDHGGEEEEERKRDEDRIQIHSLKKMV